MLKQWETYEKIAKQIIAMVRSEFGLTAVEGKQELPGRETGTTWEVDAKGIHEDGESYVLIECRRYSKKKQNQEQLAALAFKIRDTGASGGIVVSPLGLQTGAEKVAKAKNIISVKLPKDSTLETFMIEFLDRVLHSTVVHLELSPLLVSGVGEVLSKCVKCSSEFVKYADTTICNNCRA